VVEGAAVGAVVEGAAVGVKVGAEVGVLVEGALVEVVGVRVSPAFVGGGTVGIIVGAVGIIVGAVLSGNNSGTQLERRSVTVVTSKDVKKAVFA